MTRVVKVGLAVAGAGVAAGLARRYLFPRRVEEPRYDVVGELGRLELRRYAPQLRAVTEVAGERSRQHESEAFRRLARFIFGANQRREAVPMTAPVLEEAASLPHPGASRRDAGTAAAEGEVLPMTAPVLEEQQGRALRMSFVMPAAYSVATLPAPVDRRVHLEQVPPRKVAALRFSGLTSRRRVEARRAELRARLQRVGLRARAEPTLARYDPPWVLPFLRRNELLVEID